MTVPTQHTRPPAAADPPSLLPAAPLIRLHQLLLVLAHLTPHCCTLLKPQQLLMLLLLLQKGLCCSAGVHPQLGL
jgi:hypothetical protein